MIVVYYTQTFFLDEALERLRALSKKVRLHVIIELLPGGWKNSVFDMEMQGLDGGIVPAIPILAKGLPPQFSEYWKDAASVSFFVINRNKTLHPSNLVNSYRLVEYIRSLGPDVLHLDDVSLFLSLFLFRLSSVPKVLNIHDPQTHAGEGNWRNSLARKLTFSAVQKYVLHNAYQKEFFIRHYNLRSNQVSCIMLGVYNLYRYFSEDDGEASAAVNNVLLFGRLSQYKGLEVLYQAAVLAAEKIPALEVVVAGRPVRGYVVPASPELPNGGKLRLITDYIPNSQMARLFKEASVVVCPYTGATQSGVVLTAYAFEKVVVATKVGGLPEYVEDGETGVLVEPGDAHALAAALVRCLTDTALIDRIRSGGGTLRARDLDWGCITEETLNVYQSAIAGHCDNNTEAGI